MTGAVASSVSQTETCGLLSLQRGCILAKERHLGFELGSGLVSKKSSVLGKEMKMNGESETGVREGKL